MRVLLTTIGSRGDVQPLVALAAQLRAAGHEPRMCVSPDFQDWIRGLGIPVTAIGPQMRRALTATAPAAPPGGRPRPVTDDQIAAQFGKVAAAARGCDLMVVGTPLLVAARTVAESLGIAYVFAVYSPNMLPSPHHAPPPVPLREHVGRPAETDHRALWARDAEQTNQVLRGALNRHRASLGLPAVDDVRAHVMTDRPWLHADPTLGPWPDRTDGGVFQPGAWILPDDRPLAPELERFLDDGDPPVYFGFGSMVQVQEDLGHVAVRAARALGRRAVVSRGWAGLTLPEDTPDCITVGEVNEHLLFRRVAAVVHHGGAGTTTSVALAGAPHVVVPQIYDQHYWAQRVDRLGIGVAHAPGGSTSESLTRAVERALRADTAANARAVATVIRRDGTRVAVRRLTGADGATFPASGPAQSTAVTGPDAGRGPVDRRTPAAP
ncbi:glycosyltransferase [Micromonospora echinospora]|uniref:glycosyltransferase n=1 Tax=Micromonospora echinospora TaxID=1877 RepID=UPI003CF95B47